MSVFNPLFAAIPNGRVMSGSFETDGDDTDPINLAGYGFTVAAIASTTGQYRVTFTNQQFSEYIYADACISPQATSETQRAIIIAEDPANGTIDIETQSAAGTEANLDGPRVRFFVIGRQGGPERG